jgi:hypothetical protein
MDEVDGEWQFLCSRFTEAKCLGCRPHFGTGFVASMVLGHEALASLPKALRRDLVLS